MSYHRTTKYHKTLCVICQKYVSTCSKPPETIENSLKKALDKPLGISPDPTGGFPYPLRLTRQLGNMPSGRSRFGGTSPEPEPHVSGAGDVPHHPILQGDFPIPYV